MTFLLFKALSYVVETILYWYTLFYMATSSPKQLSTAELAELATLVKNVERAMIPVLREQAQGDANSKASELLRAIQSQKKV